MENVRLTAALGVNVLKWFVMISLFYPVFVNVLGAQIWQGFWGSFPEKMLWLSMKKNAQFDNFLAFLLPYVCTQFWKLEQMINNECPKKLNDSNYRRSLLDTRRAIRSVIYSGFVLSTVVLHLFGSGGAAPEWWLGKLLMFSTRISMNEFLFFTMQKTKNMNLSLNLVVLHERLVQMCWKKAMLFSSRVWFPCVYTEIYNECLEAFQAKDHCMAYEFLFAQQVPK